MHKYVKIGIILTCILVSLQINAAEPQFLGSTDKIIKITPASSTGLNAIYVAKSTQDLTISFNSSGANFEWLIYGNLGGGFAEQITNLEKEGEEYILKNPQGNKGYIIRDSSGDFNFWLVDYSAYPLKLEALSLNESSGCDATILDFTGVAADIEYFTITGKKEVLSRDISLSYNTEIWDDQSSNFQLTSEVRNLASISSTINIFPPVYATTTFKITGDRFLKEWNQEMTIETGLFSPVAVDVRARVEAEENGENDNSNQIKQNSDELGGSAPFSASFISYNTEAAIHHEWQISKDSEFETIDYRIYDSDLDYTFSEEGRSFIRYIGSNANGTCQSISDTFIINIGASELKIPNAFSPNGDGINDVWKVAYRSLIEFKCWIFDRHGHQIYHFTDPNGGWDGKNGSKFVNPGVYFYVIEAIGADGKKYKKSGDINILKSSNSNYSGNTSH